MYIAVKKVLLSLIVVAAMAVSCQGDVWNIFGFNTEVSVVLKVESPQMTDTRAAVGMDSSVGAIDNFDNNSELWSKYDLRYILEIYEVVEKDGVVSTSDETIYKRQVLTTSTYENGVNFDIRLVPNRTYKFVIWADFVNEGMKSDLYYDTADMRNISRKASAQHLAMEEALDAYHISKTVTIKGNEEITMRLTRPFAKLRVVAIDHHEISSFSTLERVELRFDTEKNPIYKSFNAVTNGVSESCNQHNYVCDVNPVPYVEYSGTLEDGESVKGFVLFSDYILAPRDGESPVSFSMDTYDQKGKVRTIDFDTQIPTCRNHLTTVVGNFLTQNYITIVSIDDTLLSDDEFIKDAEDATK